MTVADFPIESFVIIKDSVYMDYKGRIGPVLPDCLQPSRSAHYVFVLLDSHPVPFLPSELSLLQPRFLGEEYLNS